MRMNTLRTAFALLTFTIALTACAPPPAPPTLEKTSWQLTTLTHNGRITTLVTGREPRIEFSDAETVVGTTGCNGYSGTYRLIRATIYVGDLTQSLIGCDERHQRQESQFTSALQRPDGLIAKRNGAELTLSSADGSTLLTFTEIP
jgi:heat shock protein HslJ